ncbi:MAG: LLM class flavin-dependent oxidoreductase [Thermomicrobiales bacterium]
MASITICGCAPAPKPVQQKLPVLIGGKRPRMLKVIARHADLWDTGNDPEGIREALAQIQAHCREDSGRDPGEIAASSSFGADRLEHGDSFEDSSAPIAPPAPASFFDFPEEKDWNRPSAWPLMSCRACVTNSPERWKDTNPRHGLANDYQRPPDRTRYLIFYDTLIELYPNAGDAGSGALRRIGTSPIWKPCANPISSPRTTSRSSMEQFRFATGHPPTVSGSGSHI